MEVLLLQLAPMVAALIHALTLQRCGFNVALPGGLCLLEVIVFVLDEWRSKE